MFALLAAICFIAVLLGGSLGSIDLTVLGFFFIALHLLLGGWIVGQFNARTGRNN